MSSEVTGERIQDRFAGQHILITGSTGFLAKAFVEKLLRSVETVAGLHLLVRSRSGGKTAEQRVEREVLGSRVYDRLRATLGSRFDALTREKIHVVNGDLSKDRLGLSDEAYHSLARRITMIVNSAATVTFDERLDLAVELNTFGPPRLLQLARDCGNVPFMQVSTCYVSGTRRGTIPEDFSAPEAARERLPRVGGDGAYDLDSLSQSLRDEAASIMAEHGAVTEAARSKLIDAGMTRAREFGWNDTYTFTKWIGEQLLVRDHGDVPLIVFRPAIIESSYEEPTPGWIDGLRMADPLIIAYGRGKLKEFPCDPSISLDLIPVDYVANAMIATLAVGTGPGDVRLYQCGSSGRHPLKLLNFCRVLEQAFVKRPMNSEDGHPIRPPTLKFQLADAFIASWTRKYKRVQWLRQFLERFRSTRRRARKLAGTARKIEQLLYFAKIYSPYTHLDCRFADDALMALPAQLHPDDRHQFPFDPTQIDWSDYLINRHVPGLRSFALGTGSEPSARIRAVDDLGSSETSAGIEALQGSNLFEVFERTARRFPDKPALQIRRLNRWIRYSYDEAYRATGTIVKRFTERGLEFGDCIALCSENCPEWGLVYLAAMRAGFTVVPLDPQLPPDEVWAAARFVGCKLMCAGTSTINDLQAGSGKESAIDLVCIAQPFTPPPGASRDHSPLPEEVGDGAVASILFTSGTTVAPKAVQLTHRNFIANAAALIDVHPVQPSDEFLSVLPMYHAFEFMGGFIVPIACGSTVTYVERLNGPELKGAMQATGTTIMLVVPRLIRLLHEGIAAGVAASGRLTRILFRVLGVLSDLSGRRLARFLFKSVHAQFGGRLRILFSGASSLDPDLFDAFQRMGFQVYEGYGMTETAPVLTVSPPGSARPGSVGRPLPNVELEIRATNMEGVGEVWVKGPNVMTGYLKNREATEEIQKNGWLRTGDLGRIGADGYLFLTGRSKDLIITGAGKNVYPDEVEFQYRELPHVKELCVFGMPSEDGLGDAVHCVVVLDREADADLDPSSMEREVRIAAERLSETLPTHQRIAVLHFWEHELPKTSTLKAKRNEIRQIVQSETGALAESSKGKLHAASEAHTSILGSGPAKDTAAFRALREILAAQSRRSVDEVARHMHLLLDLGIDSIGKIDLIGAVESKFRMHIDDDRASKIARVADLVNVVGDRTPVAEVDATSSPQTWRQRFADGGARGVSNGRLPGSLRPLRWMVRGGVGVFMSSYVRVTGIGRENIPRTGAFILAPNHSSHLDSPSVMKAVGGARRVWIAGAEDYFFNSRMKRFVFGRLLDTIAFDRHADGMRGLQRCGEALRRGDGLLMFPEGTRTATGEMQPFRIGVAVLAIEHQVPIVPVFIDHTYNLLRKGQRFVKPGTAPVRFGTPIQPPAVDDIEDHYEAFRLLASQVEQAVIKMRSQATA